MSERPPNARPARFLERTHNSRRYHADGWDDTEAAVSGYRGSHRADRMHADGTRTAADNRSSRVGRHHADQSPDDADGW